jgi:DNA-directed RNA polymerase specialized sigma24 family protein
MKTGDAEAAENLWKVSWMPVVSHARSILSRRFRTLSDEEDIAAAVLESVFLRAQSGNFSALNDSNSYWKLLWVVVERKVARQMEHQLAVRRNVNHTVHLSTLANNQAEHQLETSEPQAPFESVVLAETLEQVFEQLDGISIQVAKLALEGHKPKEIADAMGVKIWSIYTHLAFIRNLLEKANVD